MEIEINIMAKWHKSLHLINPARFSLTKSNSFITSSPVGFVLLYTAEKKEGGIILLMIFSIMLGNAVFWIALFYNLNMLLSVSIVVFLFFLCIGDDTSIPKHRPLLLSCRIWILWYYIFFRVEVDSNSSFFLLLYLVRRYAKHFLYGKNRFPLKNVYIFLEDWYITFFATISLSVGTLL